ATACTPAGSAGAIVRQGFDAPVTTSTVRTVAVGPSVRITYTDAPPATHWVPTSPTEVPGIARGVPPSTGKNVGRAAGSRAITTRPSGEGASGANGMPSPLIGAGFPPLTSTIQIRFARPGSAPQKTSRFPSGRNIG